MPRTLLIASMCLFASPLLAQRATVTVPYVAPGNATSIAYSSGQTYQIGDVVGYSGNSYMSLIYANTGNTPSSGSPYWWDLSGAGSVGATGAQGAQGAQGIQGATGATGATGAQGAPGSGANAATSSALGSVELPAGQTSPVLSTVAITGAAADLASATFPLGPRFGIPSYICTGDSITYGEGPASKSDDYCNKIAKVLGLTPTNYGVDGYMAADWTRLEIFAHLNPTPSANPLLTALLLHNDLHWCSTIASSSNPGTQNYNADGNNTGCKANAYDDMLSGLTWVTIPINYKVLANAPTSTSGTWTSDTSIIPSGMSSSANGAYETYTFTTTATNQAVYVWYGGTDGDAGTASVAIDGTQVGTIATASTSGQCICTIDGNNSTVWAQRYVVPSASTHTLKVAVTSSSGTIHWVGLGTPPLGAPPVIAPPSVFVGAPIFENGYNDQAATNAYTAQLVTELNLLRGDGLLVQYIPTQSYENVATDTSGSNVTVPNGMGDENSGTVCTAVTSGDVGQHPNVCGHQHIADAFLGTIQPAGGGSTGTASVNFPTSPANLQGLQSLNVAGSAGSPINSGFNFYSAGSPGYETGAAFFTDNGVYRVAHYQPDNFATYAFCSYTHATNITAYSQFTCPFYLSTGAPANSMYMDSSGVVHFAQNPVGVSSGGNPSNGMVTFPVSSAGQGAIKITAADGYGQYITAATTSGAAYLLGYNALAGLWASGGATPAQVGLFGNSLQVPLKVSTTAPDGSVTVDNSGNLSLAHGLTTSAGAGLTGTITISGCQMSFTVGVLTAETGCSQ